MGVWDDYVPAKEPSKTTDGVWDDYVPLTELSTTNQPKPQKKIVVAGKGGVLSQDTEKQVTLGQSFDRGMTALGALAVPALSKIQGRDWKSDFGSALEDYSAMPTSPITENVANAYESNSGIMAPLSAIGEAVTSPIDATKYLVEQLPSALLGGGAGGAVAKNIGLQAAKKLALNKAATSLVTNISAGAGMSAGATAAGGIIPNTAGQFKETGNIDDAIAKGAKQTAAETAVAGVMGAPLNVGANSLKNVALKALGLSPTDEMLQTYAGNSAIGQETTGGDLAASAILGMIGAPGEIAGATIFKEKPSTEQDVTRETEAPKVNDIVSALLKAQEQVAPKLTISNGTEETAAMDDAVAAQKQAEYDSKLSDAEVFNEPANNIAAMVSTPNQPKLDDATGSMGSLPDTRIQPTNAMPDGTSIAEDSVISQPSQRSAKNATVKKKSGTLLGTLRNLGGVTIGDKLDVTGQDKAFAPGGYNQIFTHKSVQSLKSHIENGNLDAYLPYDMRLSNVTQDSDAYDSTPAYDYLAERIRNGEKVLPYEAHEEIQKNKFYEGENVQDDIQTIADEFNDDEINALLSEAGHDERESNTKAQDFEQGKPASDIVSSKRNETRTSAKTQNEVTGSPRSERQEVKPIVEAIVKRRAAATQLGKIKQFDTALQVAKEFMRSEQVNPNKLKNAASLFKNDKTLFDAFTQLHALAKAPAKEARAEKSNAIETYKQQIANAKTQDELQTIAGKIQRDTALNDNQATDLDDAVFEAQDKLESLPERRADPNHHERRNELDKRKNVSEMNAEEMRAALLIDDLTGIGNRRAYDESTKKPIQISIDADGLKWVNDNLGHDSGDKLLTAIGEALGRVTQDSYHISGDEFVIQSGTQLVADDIMETVNELLAEAIIEGVNSNGDKVTLKGISISYGIAKDLKDAEHKLQAHKSEREAAGKRSGRGEQPANATIASKNGENREDNTAENQDILGQNIAKQQAIADAERAKDAKRNSGDSNTEGFTLTGSNSESDKAAANGAQSLFSRLNKSQTETPTFKKWFGNSKIVDSDGNPQIVYHGSDKTFYKVNMKKGAQGVFWFTSDKSAIESGDVGASGNGIIMDMYAKIENPAGWKEYDKFSIGELLARGYDGVILPESDGSFLGFIFEPNQVKSASKNNGNFDGNNDNILFSRSNPTFYSALTRAIDNIQTKKADPKMWKGLIKNLSQKGVKPDEIEWTGINEFLDLQTGAVTKEQVLDYLNSNGVEVTETMLGDGTYAVYDGDMNQYFENRAEAEEYAREQGININEDTVFRASNRDGGYGSKYSKYTVLGGTNYKELLLTLPTGEDSAYQLKRKSNDSIVSTHKNRAEAMLAYKDLTQEQKYEHYIQPKDENKKYKSSHFDQPNILAHIRFDERTDADGNKVLFINEIQSDWGQEGKKKGFKSTEQVNVTVQKNGKVYETLVDGEVVGTAFNIEAAEEQGKQIRNEGRTKGVVQPAPFVTKTDAWVSLAIKRMMRYAANNGFDKVAFINGQQAADLYDLSKKVDSIAAIKNEDGTFAVFAYQGNRTVFDEDKVTEARLPEIIGKELAEKVAIQKGTKSVSYSGVDLKVGGEGMRTFYDSIVPKVAKDVLKKVGGVIESIEVVNNEADQDENVRYVIDADDISADGDFKQRVDVFNDDTNTYVESFNTIKEAETFIESKDTSGKQLPQLGFTITPTMRETIMGGLPLFSKSSTSGNLLVDDIKKAIKNDIYGQEVDVYQSMADAPMYIQEQAKSEGASGVEGFFDSRSNRVALIADNLDDAKRAVEVARHELIGHYGMENMLGKELMNKLINRVLEAEKSGNKTIADVAKQVDETQPKLNNKRRAKEIIAVMAERNMQNSIARRVIDAIRTFLKKIGFVKSDITDAEVAGLLRDAQVYLKESGRSFVEPEGELAFSNGVPISEKSENKKVSAEELIDGAKKYFGTTLNNKEAGYILPDGTMLDFTGRHTTDKSNWHYMRGERSTDHREFFGENIHNNSSLENLIEAKDGNDAMREFMAKTGAMRVDFSAGVASVMTKPTPQQIKLFGDGNRGEEVSITFVDGKSGRIVDETDISSANAIKVSKFFEQASTKPVDDKAPLFSRKSTKVDKHEKKSFTDLDFANRLMPKSVPFLLGRDELGNINFTAGKRAKDFIHAVSRPLAIKAGMANAPLALQKMMNQQKASMAKAMKAAGEIAETTKSMSVNEANLIGRMIVGEMYHDDVPPEHAIKIAAVVEQMFEEQGKRKVELGMLDASKLEEGNYLPRYYNRSIDPELKGIKNTFKRAFRSSTVQGINGGSNKGRGQSKVVPASELSQWESLGWKVIDKNYESKKSLNNLDLIKDGKPLPDNGNVRIWRDYDQSTRKQMGEIEDFRLRTVLGYISSQRDIALGTMFKQIAENAEFSNYTGGKGFAKVPDTTIPESNVKTYGALSGMYVKDEILSHINKYEANNNEFLKYYKAALSKWKEGKTVLNPVSHMNNFASNYTMAHLAGVSYWDGEKYLFALKEMSGVGKDKGYIEEAEDAGLFEGGMTQVEFMRNMPPEIRKMADIAEDSPALKTGRFIWKLASLGLNEKAGNLYTLGDSFYKYVIYRDARNKGLSPEDAAIHATNYIFNYDDLPSTARGIRDYGIPFFSYTYKSIPRLMDSALEYPWRFAAPATIISTIGALTYAALAGDDDDWWLTAALNGSMNAILNAYTFGAYGDKEIITKGEKLETSEMKNLAPWDNGMSIFGTQKNLRLGTDEKTGLPVYDNIYRFMPGGDMLDSDNEKGGVGIFAPFMPSSPMFSIYSSIIDNKQWNGKDLVDSNDTNKERAAKYADWAWKFAMPNISVGGAHYDRLMDATANYFDTTIKMPWKDYTGYGKDGLPVQLKYAVAQTVGIKVRPVDLNFNKKMNILNLRKEKTELQLENRRDKIMLQKKSISRQEYDRRLKVTLEKIDIIKKKDKGIRAQ
jgi:GGDEF domain-containing protein